MNPSPDGRDFNLGTLRRRTNIFLHAKDPVCKKPLHSRLCRYIFQANVFAVWMLGFVPQWGCGVPGSLPIDDPIFWSPRPSGELEDLSDGLEVLNLPGR